MGQPLTPPIRWNHCPRQGGPLCPDVLESGDRTWFDLDCFFGAEKLLRYIPPWKSMGWAPFSVKVYQRVDAFTGASTISMC